MPARDLYHDTVKSALIKDGWTITHDPLALRWGARDLFVDLGAERLLAAERGEEKIAVEVKSFSGPSDMAELERALGQYVLYRDVLAEQQPERTLYLAVTVETAQDVFQEPLGQLVRRNHQIRLIVFDPPKEAIVQWIP